MSKADKNERKKQYRKKQLERKHFNEPLPKFLEVKYPTIFEEYKDLYETIVKQNGKKRIATKTDTFKEWKSSVEQYTDQTAGPICETRSVAETTTLTGPSSKQQMESMAKLKAPPPKQQMESMMMKRPEPLGI